MSFDSPDKSPILGLKTRPKGRKRSHRNQKRRGIAGALNSLSTKSWDLSMLVFTVVTVAIQSLYLMTMSGWYQDMYLGQTAEELSYGLGTPINKTGTISQGEWAYRRTGFALSAILEDGKTSAIQCRMIEIACSPPMDLPKNVDEYHILAYWGPPTSVSYPRGRKTIFYRGIGVTLELVRYKVVDVKIEPASRLPLTEFLWIFTP